MYYIVWTTLRMDNDKIIEKCWCMAQLKCINYQSNTKKEFSNSNISWNKRINV